MKEKIKKISEIHNLKLNYVRSENEKKTPGMGEMINAVFGGYGEYDGYKIETDKDIHYVLINNGQSCCESWGYISSNDNLDEYTGKILKEIVLTDVALKNQKVEELYLDEGAIQFVNFKFEDGDLLQLAVYNSHNGYYGHSIIVGSEKNILVSEVL